MRRAPAGDLSILSRNARGRLFQALLSHALTLARAAHSASLTRSSAWRSLTTRASPAV